MRSSTSSERCVAADVLGELRMSFREDIDLMDETLREGAERATCPLRCRKRQTWPSR